MSRKSLRAQHHRAGTVAAATLAFIPSARADETPHVPAFASQETWWYSQSLNTVLAFRPCPQRTLCTRIVWREWHDRRLADVFLPRGTRNAPVPNMCNYQLQAQFNRVNANRYDGRMNIPARNMNVSLRVDIRNAGEMRLQARAGLLFRNETLQRVNVGDVRYSACQAHR